MDKPAPTERSRPHNISSAGSPTGFKSFSSVVRNSIRSPSRDWSTTLHAVMSPTLKTDTSSQDKSQEKSLKQSTNKVDYGFKEKVAQVTKNVETAQAKMTASYTSPRPSKGGVTQDSTPDSKSSGASKNSTPKIAAIGSNPYLLYQFVADKSLSQSMPNMNDKVTSLSKELEDSVKTIGEKEKEIEQLKLSLAENLGKLLRQSDNLAQVKEDKSQVEKSLKETCEKLTLNLTQREEEIASLKAMLEKVNEEQKRNGARAKEEEAKVQQWKSQVINLEQKIKTLENELSALSRADEEAKEKRKEINELKLELADKDKELKDIEQRNKSLEEQVKILKVDLEGNINKSEEKLRSEISQLKGIIASLEGRINNYKDIEAKFEQLKKELSSNKYILEEKQSRIDLLESEINGFKKEQEVSHQYYQQISEAKDLINKFKQKSGIPSGLELVPGIQSLISESVKSQHMLEEALKVKEEKDKVITKKDNNSTDKESLAKISLLEAEKSDLMTKLEEAQNFIKSIQTNVKSKDLEIEELKMNMEKEKENSILQEKSLRHNAENISKINELRDQNSILQNQLKETQEANQTEVAELQEKISSQEQHIEALVADVNLMKEFIIERHGDSVFEKDGESETRSEESQARSIRVLEQVREVQEAPKYRAILPVEDSSTYSSREAQEVPKRRAFLPVDDSSIYSSRQSIFSVEQNQIPFEEKMLEINGKTTKEEKSPRKPKGETDRKQAAAKGAKKTVAKPSKFDIYKEKKPEIVKFDLTKERRAREEDPVYKQLEKMIKDLNEKVVNSEKKAKKIFEEKLQEASKAYSEKEQLMLCEMDRLREEKKELLKKIDDIQWDKAYEYTQKMKSEKQEEMKAAELAEKFKQAALEASKKKKKK